MAPCRRGGTVAPMRVSARVRGFTMVDTMVALAAVAVLLAIAAVAFPRQGQQATGSRVDLTFDLVVTAEQDLASRFGSYSTWASDLGVAGSVTQVVAQEPVTAPGTVSAAVGAAGTLGLATVDDTGACHLLRVHPVDAGGASQRIPVPQGAVCSGPAALPTGEVAVEQTGPVRQP